MTSQMKSFIWKGKRPSMNWMDVTQPRSNGGLDLPDIEARLEAIQITWLKKYLAPITERPMWAFVTDQIVFKYMQKAPVVNDQNKINWVLQIWDITDTKEKKVPNYIKEMLKIGRKYNIGYDTIVMNIEWDYSYYQPWSDNKWLVDEMLAMQEEMLISQNKDITMQ